MATVAFADSSARIVKEIVETESKTLKVLPDKTSTKIQPLNYSLSNPKSIDYSIIKPIKSYQQTKAESVLPFRVQFTTIIVEGYTASRPAPIGIAIVGTNNYIL